MRLNLRRIICLCFCFRQSWRLASLCLKSDGQIRFFHNSIIFRSHFHRHPSETIYVDFRPCVTVFPRNLNTVAFIFIFYIIRCDQIPFYITWWYSIITEHQRCRCSIMNTVPDFGFCQEIFRKISGSVIHICCCAVCHIFFKICTDPWDGSVIICMSLLSVSGISKFLCKQGFQNRRKCSIFFINKCIVIAFVFSQIACIIFW